MRDKSTKRTHKSILILIIACVAAFAVLAFVEGPALITKQITGLKMEQDGFNINVSWDKMECDGYDLTIVCEGKLTLIPTEETTYTIQNVQPDKIYNVTVSARLKSGGNSREAEAQLTAGKLKQKIEVNLKKYNGFKEDELQLEAAGQGDISFRSSDRKIAKVDRSGYVTLIDPGHTNIRIHATGDGMYDPADCEIPINVYPEELEKPKKVLALNESDTRCKISWKAVDFADTYKLLKKNPATKKYETIKKVDGDTLTAEITRDNGKYAIKASAELKGKTIKSPVSDSVKVVGTASKAKSYSSGKILMRLNESNMDLVRSIHGEGNTRIPQSFCMTDDCYVVSYVNMAGTAGKLISYRKSDAECVGIDVCSNMGHANGCTYNPNTNKFYVVKTHKSIRTAECATFDGTTKESKGAFNLPKVTSGIAYDESNNKYYLSKGNELYVCNSDFKVESFIHKFVRYNHAQDIGAYNGVILVCTWVSGHTSYIDLYRSSDGKYLGTFDVSIGEIESCLVDDGYLVILMNVLGTNNDLIYKTKERIPIP